MKLKKDNERIDESIVPSTKWTDDKRETRKANKRKKTTRAKLAYMNGMKTAMERGQRQRRGGGSKGAREQGTAGEKNIFLRGGGYAAVSDPSNSDSHSH